MLVCLLCGCVCVCVGNRACFGGCRCLSRLGRPHASLSPLAATASGAQKPASRAGAARSRARSPTSSTPWPTPSRSSSSAPRPRRRPRRRRSGAAAGRSGATRAAPCGLAPRCDATAALTARALARALGRRVGRRVAGRLLCALAPAASAAWPTVTQWLASKQRRSRCESIPPQRRPCDFWGNRRVEADSGLGPKSCQTQPESANFGRNRPSLRRCRPNV